LRLQSLCTTFALSHF